MSSSLPKISDWRVDREMRRAYERECREQSESLRELPHDRIAALSDGLKAVPLRAWRSRRFLVVLYEDRLRQRLSVQRCRLRPDGHWEDGISWDDLQRLKAEAGFGDRWAIEIYPPDSETVNVANIRHLWLLAEAPTCCWTKDRKT